MERPESRKFACTIAEILDNKKAKDIDILNIANISVIADFFVICSGTSSPHVKTLAAHTSETVKKIFEVLPQKEEADLQNRWCLLDYGDVIVHIMHEEERHYYAIEKFWSHACRINAAEWKQEFRNMKVEL